MIYNPKHLQHPEAMALDAPNAKPKHRSWTEYIFCLFVGSTYIYALSRVIVSATFIQVEQFRLFFMGLGAMLLFAVILFNKYTRIITGALLLLGALYVFFTLERWESQLNHLYNVRRMVQGYLPYQPELGLTVLWAICLLLGLVVAIFMLYRFSFYIVSITGVTIFLFTWGPGFTRDVFSFLLFLVCFCLLLIRKTNNGLAAMYIAAPICAALVWLVHGSVPREAELFQRRTLQELFDGPLSAIGDFIYTLTNPMYFSFQSTGFSGHGGRLGGPVSPNTRNVMTVQAPGRTYLTGVTHNVYTGYRWFSDLEHGDLYTQGMAQGRFEMLETTAALIRGATLADERTAIPTSLLWGIFPLYDHLHLATRHFATLGLDGYDLNMYLHTYLPMDQATIAIGSNRTGTVFRAPNTRQLWFHAAGPDYLPNLVFDPTGDMRAPGFMARGTQYSMNFLNVNSRLTFIQEMLNQSYEGLYAGRTPPELVFPYTIAQTRLVHMTDGAVISDVIGDSGPLVITNNNTGESWAITDEREEIMEYWIDFRHTDLARLLNDESTALETITVNDINNIFELFAHQSPTRELSYITTQEELITMLDIFSQDVLSRYAESVREHFLYVPEITPQRVHDKVAEIIDGLETDFEKVMAIRDYLVQFPYTLTTQPVPDGVCFVDHFLFVGQEGYCVYYATAMAVMSRIAGVPSRYVEGFLLPPAEGDQSIFVVTNMMAHAWVEVYLEGFGWLIVEATAPYAFFMDPTVPPPVGGINPYMHMSEWIDWWEDEFPFYNGGAGFDPGVFNAPEYPAEVPERGLPTLARVRIYVLIGLGALVLLGIAFFVMRCVQMALKVRRVRRLGTNQQIAAYFNGIVDITSHIAKPKDPSETPYAYGHKVGRRFAFKSDSVLLKDLVDLYYKAVYGNSALSENERNLMADSYFDMVEHLRYENRKVNFIYMRYIQQVGAL
ncbi:MAG: transglutaminase-like domain-containing protein [Defluviitaleaceae bacterium]|nr:transglutaminase-like domain-containing protein [Defluviitaleaceae bacterium]